MSAAQKRDRAWLKQQLMAALHWDPDVAEGVLGLILNASKPEEVQEITAAYMDNNPQAVCAISDFMEAKQGGKKPQQAQQQAQHQRQQQPQQHAGSSRTNVPGARQAEPAASKQQQQDKWLHLGTPPQPPAEQAQPPAAADAAPQVGVWPEG
jgi:hypothetical protein